MRLGQTFLLTKVGLLNVEILLTIVSLDNQIFQTSSLKSSMQMVQHGLRLVHGGPIHQPSDYRCFPINLNQAFLEFD